MARRPNLERFQTLIEGPAPAVIATYRKNGTVKLSPVWFRLKGDFFEVVIADDDVKLKHITRDPRVTLLIFESTAPFRGIQVHRSADIQRQRRRNKTLHHCSVPRRPSVETVHRAAGRQRRRGPDPRRFRTDVGPVINCHLAQKIRI